MKILCDVIEVPSYVAWLKPLIEIGPKFYIKHKSFSFPFSNSIIACFFQQLDALGRLMLFHKVMQIL